LNATSFEIAVAEGALLEPRRLACFLRAGMGAGTLHVNVYFHRCEAGRKLGLVLSEGLVWIAVQPMLARLRRCDHGMSASVRVFAGVLIRRAVAAQRDSTCLARPQMNPVAADLYAFFAFATMRLLDRLNRDRIQMRTASRTHDRLA
jgi:hypothetical protein